LFQPCFQIAQVNHIHHHIPDVQLAKTNHFKVFYGVPSIATWGNFVLPYESYLIPISRCLFIAFLFPLEKNSFLGHDKIIIT
jgi:hypothetical protein